MSGHSSPKGLAYFTRRCASWGLAWCLTGIAVVFFAGTALGQVEQRVEDPPRRDLPLKSQASSPPSPSAGQAAPTSQAMPTPEAIEAEVYQNVLNQSLDGQNVPDLNLPEPFLKRVADRAVRLSYEKRYRIVVKDEPTGGTLQSGSTSRPTAPGGSMNWLAITVLALGAVIILIAVWGFKRRPAR